MPLAPQFRGSATAHPCIDTKVTWNTVKWSLIWSVSLEVHQHHALFPKLWNWQSMTELYFLDWMTLSFPKRHHTLLYLISDSLQYYFGHTMLVSYNIMLLCQRASIPFPPFLVAKFDNTQPPSKEASPGQKGLVSKSGKSFVLTGHFCWVVCSWSFWGWLAGANQGTYYNSAISSSRCANPGVINYINWSPRQSKSRATLRSPETRLSSNSSHLTHS